MLAEEGRLERRRTFGGETMPSRCVKWLWDGGKEEQNEANSFWLVVAIREFGEVMKDR